MRTRYDQYVKSKETQSEEAVPSVPEETEESFPGKSVYLCIEASDGAQVEAVLDVLDAQGARAAFYCTEEFLEKEGDLLRRMAATGQTIGILTGGEDRWIRSGGATRLFMRPPAARHGWCIARMRAAGRPWNRRATAALRRIWTARPTG